MKRCLHILTELRSRKEIFNTVKKPSTVLPSIATALSFSIRLTPANRRPEHVKAQGQSWKVVKDYFIRNST